MEYFGLIVVIFMSMIVGYQLKRVEVSVSTYITTRAIKFEKEILTVRDEYAVRIADFEKRLSTIETKSDAKAVEPVVVNAPSL